MDGYMGEVKMFAANYPPRNWAFCQGQLLAISEYSSLFSLLGTTYGGDGITSFALPDLRGRIPVGSGAGPGLTPRITGQQSGHERVNLSEANLPSHQHAIQASKKTADKEAPSSSAVLASQARGGTLKIYAEDQIDTTMKPTGSCGNNQAVENMQPWLSMNYIICLIGEYPPRD